MEAADWPMVCQIYQEGIDTGIATLETSTPDWEDWDAAHLPYCRLVAMDQEQMAGWAVLSPYSKRAVYSGVAEDSVYVANSYRGKGVGSFLLEALITESEKQGIWTLQAGISAKNTASIQLHQKAGFRIVGVRERISQRLGEWQDIMLMERRSTVVGI